MLDVARRMEVAVDLGSGRGWVTRHLMSESVGRLTAIELSPGMLAEAPGQWLQEVASFLMVPRQGIELYTRLFPRAVLVP